MYLGNLRTPSHLASLDQVPSYWQVTVALPTRMRLAVHSMVTVVPGVEAAQLSCFDPSTVNDGHSGAEWKSGLALLAITEFR